MLRPLPAIQMCRERKIQVAGLHDVDPIQSKPARHQRQLAGQGLGRLRRRGPRLQVCGLDAQEAGLAVGLEVHAGGDGLAQQQGQHIIAVLALVGRSVDLQPDAAAEQALGPLPAPDEVVEGREQGGAR